jgi:hypothetical protein
MSIRQQIAKLKDAARKAKKYAESMTGLFGAVAQAEAEAAEALANKREVKRKFINPSLFDICYRRKDWGVGQKFTRTVWKKFPEPCFWEITRSTAPIVVSTRARAHVHSALTARAAT